MERDKELKDFIESFKSELYNFAQQYPKKSYAELSVDNDFGYVFAINCEYNYDQQAELITYLNITRAWFQFPDFEATLDEQYVWQIEEVFNQ